MPLSGLKRVPVWRREKTIVLVSASLGVIEHSVDRCPRGLFL